MAPPRLTKQATNFIKIILLKARRRRQMLTNMSLLITAIKRKRLQILMGLLSLLTIVSQSREVHRSCRRLTRNNGWWELVWKSYTDDRFKRTFRVSKDTFTFIPGRIRHDLERKTVNEDPISPECRLGICLYRLARGDYYYTISEMAGLGVSTIHGIVSQVCQSIVENLWKEFVASLMPVVEKDFQEMMDSMNSMWQFPFCWGALDGCHIPIKSPPGGAEACKEYYNFKNFYSVVLMAMVDSKYRFFWGSCGFPGNSHDSIIFQATDMWDKIQNQQTIPDIGMKVAGVIIHPLIVADSAFSLQPWLSKPYTEAVLSEKMRYFNYRLSRARMVTEGAFGQLKGRWRILLRKNESTPEEVTITTLACMVLHNICITNGDAIPPTLDLTINPTTNARKSSDEIRDELHMTKCRRVRNSNSQAKKVRNALANKLWMEKES